MRSIYVLTSLFCLLSIFAVGQEQNEFTIQIDKPEGSNWWVGIIGLGHKMPLAEDLNVNTLGKGFGNQVQPLILSDQGDVIWSESPLAIESTDKILKVTSNDKIEVNQVDGGLKSAYQFASNNYFAPSGKMPDELLFTYPQYNTCNE